MKKLSPQQVASAQKKEKVVQLYNEGLPVTEIAERLGYRYYNTVYSLLKRAGVSPVREKTKIESTNLKRLEALELYQAGASVTEIRQKTGLNRQTITDFLKELGYDCVKPWYRYSIGRKDFFTTIDTEEKAYFLGWIVSDGCLFTDGSRHTIRLGIAQSDQSVVERFRVAVESTNPIRIYTKNGKNLKPIAEITLSSKTMFYDLAKYGAVPNKSDKTFYPDLPNTSLIHAAFIRGLFEGNGCACVSRNRVHWTLVGTSELLDGVSKKLNYFTGVRYKEPRKYKEKRFLHRLVYSSRWEINALFDFLYDNAIEDLCLPRKKDKLGYYRRLDTTQIPSI